MTEKINKMPKFYMILPEKYFSRILGATAPLPPVSYAYEAYNYRDFELEPESLHVTGYLFLRYRMFTIHMCVSTAEAKRS